MMERTNTKEKNSDNYKDEEDEEVKLKKINNNILM